MTASVSTTRLGVVLSIVLLLAALTWSACDEDGSGPNAALEPTPSSEFPSLRMLLEVPPSVRLGERVPLRLTVENVTEAPVQFWIGGTEDTNFVGSYDFVVTGADGSEVWRWLAGLETWQTILSRVELDPGEQLRFHQEWPQADNRGRAVEAGTYLVHAVLELEREGSQRVGLETLETEERELVISP
jgi:hypothetical protein